jgi:hypothetical protein
MRRGLHGTTVARFGKARCRQRDDAHGFFVGLSAAGMLAGGRLFVARRRSSPAARRHRRCVTKLARDQDAGGTGASGGTRAGGAADGRSGASGRVTIGSGSASCATTGSGGRPFSLNTVTPPASWP